MSRNYLLSLGAPAGTTTTETNPAYKGPVASASSPARRAPSTSAAAGDWPSYNRTVNSDRYSPLGEINAANVAKLKVLCTYDVGGYKAFESGLIMVNNALIGTTEFDIFSINPATCALKWRTHEDYPPALLPSNRGAAYLDGMLFRGTQDGRVLAYDFKTGKRIWETTIADPKHGESVPAAPIAHDGVVYIGNAGGDSRAARARCTRSTPRPARSSGSSSWCPKSKATRFADPWASRRSTRRRGNSRRAYRSAVAASGRPTRSIPRPACCTSPAAIRRLISRSACARATTFTPTRSSSSTAKTGDYKNHFKLVPKDWHDWDVSSPPILIQTMGGKQLMVVAPKDGYLYAFDLANNNAVFKVPVTRIENVAETFTHGQRVHFCPGGAGGSEWNGPSYVPQTNLILIGEIEWCDTADPKNADELRTGRVGQPWAGVATLNPFWSFGQFDKTWAGWVYAVDADTGIWKWRLKTNYPITGGLTPTAGGVAFVGDMGGNFYALDSATGQKLWGQDLGAAIGGGVITYTAGGAQKVAVAAGVSMIAWPTKPVHAKVVVLGLDRRCRETNDA